MKRESIGEGAERERERRVARRARADASPPWGDKQARIPQRIPQIIPVLSAVHTEMTLDSSRI